MNLDDFRSNLGPHRTSDRDLADRDALVNEAEGLLQRAGDQALDGADRSRFDELTRQLEDWDKRDRWQADMREGVRSGRYGLEPTEGPLPGAPEVMRRTSDPHSVDAARSFRGPAATRDRALAAVERSTAPDAGKERAARLLDANPDDHVTAMWARTTTNPSYRRAFEKVIRNPEAGPLLLDADEQRAVGEMQQARSALAVGSGTGGYLMPFELDPTVIVTNAGATNPIRQIARVETVSTNIWHGVSSAGVSAEWLGELSEAADATPTFVQPTVQVYKASAYAEASVEFAADTTGGEQLAMLFADARDRLEAAAHATGSGSGQPAGIVTRVAAVTASRVAATTNDSYGSPDVYLLANALPPRHRPNASWIGELTTLNRTRQFDTSGGSSFWANLGMGQPETLLGKPIYEVSNMDGTLGTGNDDILMIGDFKNYLIADRLGMAVQFDPMVRGSNRRPTGAVSWWAYWRTGADCLNTDAFRLLRV